VRGIVRQLEGGPYGQWQQIFPDVRVRFRDAGHIIGSAICELEVQEKGEVRRLVFTGDTEPCETTVAVARGADLLVHDGTFSAEEQERARVTGHSTAVEAARVAAEAEVSLLALTHLSSRYFGPAIEKEAREVFERTVVPRDFDVIDIPFPEKEEPTLVKWKDVRAAALAQK